MLTVEKREKGWALVARVGGKVQERPFHYKTDAERALNEFLDYPDFQLAGEFNHYFQKRP